MDDRSTGKETRSLAPFVDLLDLHDLILAEDGAGSAVRPTLPGRLASTSASPAAADDAAHFSAKLAPLPAAPSAPDMRPDAETPIAQEAGAAQMLQAQPLQIASAASVQAVTVAKAGGASGAQAAKASKEQAPTGDDDAGHDIDLDGIRVRIVQHADIDQDADVEVAVEADAADVTVQVEAEIDVEQNAAIVVHADLDPDDSTTNDPADDVSVGGRQDVDIDTILRVAVTGYKGEIVITTTLSEEADVDQSANAVFLADSGDEVFDIDVSQHLDIDVLSDIDIDISEVDGRLHINLSIRDVAEGDDEVRFDVTESADDVLDIDLRQEVDVSQRVSVDLDVEQELARLFDIDVDVDSDIDVRVRQVAEVEADLAADGRADWDVDGASEIDIENQLRIRIDFTTV